MSAAVVILVLGLVACSGSDEPGPAPPTSIPTRTAPSRVVDAVGAARQFLADYVDPDGRVVRRDQGGDTVSEGQAYGLMLAVQADDSDAVQRIWSWTVANLQRPDGLLSWRWAGGVVSDANSAADADLYTAQALVLAGREFGDADLATAGTRVAQAVLDRETTTTGLGRILLAGTWTTSAPWQVNPSYAAPLAFDTLESALPDPRWAQLRTGTTAVLTSLLRSSPLPPDWAQVQADGRVEAMPAPDGAAVGFGLDAARVVVQDSASCDAVDRATIATLAPVLVRAPDAVRGGYDLGGAATVQWSHPLALVAAAGAATAAGDRSSASQLLGAAADLDERTPTYYGSAWVALGAGLLGPAHTPATPPHPPPRR
ncbi:MAG: glycosyl hydrolase family 8, partial [Janthinobacterium lividum]